MCIRDRNKTIQELWTSTVSYYSNYTLESIRDNIVELASLIVKTSSANEAGKIMAVRKKYANKKFAKISQIPGKYFENQRYLIGNVFRCTTMS